jgi:integrase
VKDSTGKTARKHRGVHLGWKSEVTKGAAEEKLQKIIYHETGQGVAPSDRVTLSWFWENRFRPMREGGWEEATKDVNIRDFEHYIKPKLGERTLAEFDKFVLQLHLNALAKADYSKPVIQRVKTLLSSLFLEAVELEFLLKNPMSQKKVRMPKCKPQHKPVIDAADVRRTLSSLRDRLIFRLGVFLGPRTSEVFGFTVNDWKGDFLEICNTAYNGTLRKAKVKTDGSHRTVPVPPDKRAMLKRWIEENPLKGDDLLFPARTAGPLCGPASGCRSTSNALPDSWTSRFRLPFRSCGVHSPPATATS